MEKRVLSQCGSHQYLIPLKKVRYASIIDVLKVDLFNISIAKNAENTKRIFVSLKR